MQPIGITLQIIFVEVFGTTYIHFTLFTVSSQTLPQATYRNHVSVPLAPSQNVNYL